jgi:ribosome biogenesis SPOUT family RNA methylase Rps3
MSKKKPNIITPFDDKQRFKNLVQEVISDTTIFTYIPDSISLSGNLFTLTLSNKKFVFEDIKVDIESDYVDIYLQGIKKPADTYSVTDSGTNIVINFTENITLRPQDIVATDFSVKGKIVSR